MYKKTKMAVAHSSKDVNYPYGSPWVPTTHNPLSTFFFILDETTILGCSYLTPLRDTPQHNMPSYEL